MYIKRFFWFIFSIALTIALILGLVKPSHSTTTVAQNSAQNTSNTIYSENYLLAEAQTGEFILPPLPYSYSALDPYIDSQTMMTHHDKHHAGYVKNLNAAIAKHPELKGKTVEELLLNLDSIPDDIRNTVRNNGGGHANHTIFWSIMTPNSSEKPGDSLAQAIDNAFGSLENFQQEFNAAGKTRFGSGWVWLVLTPENNLEIISTANQDSPWLEGKYPILGNDVWEHAYYLKYQNNRGDYLNNWWNVVNWQKVEQRYELAIDSLS